MTRNWAACWAGVLCLLTGQAAAVLKVPSCTPSIADYISSAPDLSVWVSSVSDKDGVVYVKDCPGDMPNSFTVFVGTTQAVAGLLTYQNVSGAGFTGGSSGEPGWSEALVGNVGSPAQAMIAMPNGTLCRPANVGSSVANAVALYNQLPQGAFTADQLLEFGTLRTALAFVTGDDAFALTFYQRPDGRVCVNGTAGDGDNCIVASYFGCDGVMHATDTIFTPTRDPADVPDTLTTMYAIPAAALLADAPPEPAAACLASLAQALGGAEGLAWTAAATSALPTQQLLDLLASPRTAVTMLVSTDAAYRARFNASAPDELSLTSLRAGVVYQMLPRPYCARELVQLGSVNSVYGELRHAVLPLNFSRDAGGQVVVRGASGEAVPILRAQIVCGSILYVVGGYLGLPAGNRTTPTPELLDSILPLGSLLTPRPLHTPLFCANTSAVGYSTLDGTAAPPIATAGGTPSRGLRSGVIAAIVAGTALVAVSGVAATAVFTRRRRRRLHDPWSEDVEKMYNRMGAPEDTPAVPSREAAAPGSSAGGSGGSGSPPSAWDIPADALEVDLDDAGERVVLGRGGFGVVYRGMLNGVQPVAIKVLRHPGDDCRQAFIREVAIMQHVSRDRNVVQFYGTAAAGDDLMIVSEVLEGGDLRGALAGPRREEMRWGQAGKGIALDVARGLCFLHANSVIHRDLKSKNILLSGDRRTAKVADVGTAAIHGEEGYLTIGAGHVVGTLAWAAPELLLNGKVSPAADIYSFGILLWELVTQQVPKRGYVTMPPPVDDCPRRLVELIQECTSFHPKKRPTARQAYERLLACPQ